MCKKETHSRCGLTHHLLQYKCLFQNLMETARYISFIFLPCLWLVASLSMRCSIKEIGSWQELSVQLCFSIKIAWNNKLHVVLRQNYIQGLICLNQCPGLFTKFWKLFGSCPGSQFAGIMEPDCLCMVQILITEVWPKLLSHALLCMGSLCQVWPYLWELRGRL